MPEVLKIVITVLIRCVIACYNGDCCTGYITSIDCIHPILCSL